MNTDAKRNVDRIPGARNWMNMVKIASRKEAQRVRGLKDDVPLEH
jgi:hypothetical protein